ncbi:J domain-containing protein [Deinococcus sp. RIT780]|nr:J domain-containing protein [Deinococcus sp. RIT780]
MDLSAPKGDRAKSWAEIYEQVTLAARQLQAQGVVWQPRTKDTAFTPVGDLWAARGDARALVGALQERTTPQAAASTPHEVLEVSPTATLEDIKAAYRRLAKQYHPDRVASLGPEFRLLAEQRMKQINAAYEALTGR